MTVYYVPFSLRDGQAQIVRHSWSGTDGQAQIVRHRWSGTNRTQYKTDCVHHSTLSSF